MDRTSYNRYLSHCQICVKNNETFNTFKSKKEYRQILEHLTTSMGIQYINFLKKYYKEYLKQVNWDKISENDKIGSPILSNFIQLSDFTKITKFSPTTIRYIATGLDILHTFKLKNPDDKKINIVEIGGGYGGQCKVLQDMTNLFDLEINSYTIIDYDIVCDLQRKYLKRLNYNNVKFVHFNDKKSLFVPKHNLLISNYALGEINRNYQDYYVKNVVSKAENVYMIWNMTKLHPYFETDKFNRKTEEPQTGRNNIVITNKQKLL